MAKRKKSNADKSIATIRDVFGIVKKPKPTYRCLRCGNEGHQIEMLINVMVGDREIPGSHLPVIPGKVVVRAPVCRFCH